MVGKASVTLLLLLPGALPGAADDCMATVACGRAIEGAPPAAAGGAASPRAPDARDAPLDTGSGSGSGRCFSTSCSANGKGLLTLAELPPALEAASLRSILRNSSALRPGAGTSSAGSLPLLLPSGGSFPPPNGESWAPPGGAVMACCEGDACLRTPAGLVSKPGAALVALASFKKFRSVSPLPVDEAATVALWPPSEMVPTLGCLSPALLESDREMASCDSPRSSVGRSGDDS